MLLLLLLLSHTAVSSPPSSSSHSLYCGLSSGALNTPEVSAVPGPVPVPVAAFDTGVEAVTAADVGCSPFRGGLKGGAVARPIIRAAAFALLLDDVGVSEKKIVFGSVLENSGKVVVVEGLVLEGELR